MRGNADGLVWPALESRCDWSRLDSAVNFYNQLKYATPKNKRPTIRGIHYASPGLIDIMLDLPLAIQIIGIVSAVTGSILAGNKTYNTIYKDARIRKLLSTDIQTKELELTNKQIDFIIHADEKIAKLLKLDPAAVIEQRAEHSIIAMKILFSFYRRVRTLAEYQERGKIRLPQSANVNEDGELL